MPVISGGPDFIGVGSQKCGTSWIGYILSQHPGIHFPRKEVNFFVRHFHRGHRWYRRWFKDRGDKKAGEITPNSIYSPRPDAAHRQFYPRWLPREWLTCWRRHPSARDEIAKCYPEAKVFMIFRNPVERAWSHYWMWRNRKERIGKERQVVPFSRMFEDDGRWIRTQGFYGGLLAHWREKIPGVGVFLYDDLKSRPLELTREIYRFVGVDDSFRPEFTSKVNLGSYPAMGAEERSLLVETYREDNRRLSALLGRDLGHWMDKP